jgi:ABC-type transport system, involved in lipoprotein release, permease component
MKIMNQLTWRYLKENKKRTILTILCIAVSVIMISCVGITFHSGKNFYRNYLENNEGDYHYAIVSDNKELVQNLSNDKQIDEYYFSSSETFEWNDKDVISIKRGDSLYFEKYHMKDYLIEGRMPENYREIVIVKDNIMNKKIGDTITLSLYGEKENYIQDFQIVGYINKMKSQVYTSYTIGEYDAFSYIDLQRNNAYYTLYIKDKDVSSNIFNHANQIIQDYKLNEFDLRYHGSYLSIQDIFEEGSQSTFLTVYKLVAFILVLIVIISIFIIYQAFHLSTYDRIQYLGILSSVGVTPKQKKRSVYFEGLILSCISIPLGIIISFVGLWITFTFLNQLEIIKNLNTALSPSISLLYLFIVIILSLITIAISLYLPAKMISRISVIDALSKSDEIKVKSKKLKSNFITKHFNISWQIALKNYKRQGKRSRVIVISLIISMVSFVSIYSFGKKLSNEISSTNLYEGRDVFFNIAQDKEEVEKVEKILSENEYVDDYYAISNVINNYYINMNKDYLTFDVENEDSYAVKIIGINHDKFKELCQNHDISYKDNMLLAYNGTYANNDTLYKKRFQKIDKNFIKSLSYEYLNSQDKTDYIKLPLFDSIELFDDDPFQKNYYFDSQSELYFIVEIDYLLNIDFPYLNSIDYNITSSHHKELTQQLNDLEYRANDLADTFAKERQLYFIVEVFIYGFVCIMIFFTLLNIINLMSASIEKRKKELAMLMSVGMSPRDLKKMIFKESLIYGLKTFIYGIPICLFVELMMYQVINRSITIPIEAYLISFVVIMIVMLLTFKAGLHRFQKQNIIESLKDDM